MVPELSRLIAVDRIGSEGLVIQVDASPAECQALARRMQLAAVLALSCRFELNRAPQRRIDATGRLAARVVQTCIVSLEEFEASVEEDFAVSFVPEGAQSDELELEGTDEIPYIGDMIDLGEATAQQLALALDPYPRQPGAARADDPASPAPHPFAALGALRQRH